MRRNINLHIIFKYITLLTIILFIGWGFVMVLAELKPFWLDEWFIIYNLKYRSVHDLWGALSFMQQFPRTYLQLIRAFSSALHYSYFSLRFPSFLVHSAGIVFCYYLSGQLYKDNYLKRFMWVLIYISFGTSLEYFIQVKQYTMEMLLSLAGIWQMLYLKQIADTGKYKATTYAILCLSFVAAPFFSYTYPIVVAPIMLIFLFYRFGHKLSNARMKVWIPLGLCAGSIVAFYFIELRHVMQDQGMQVYWQDYMLQGRFDAIKFVQKTFDLFGNLGSGDLFRIIFGILGIAGWMYAMWKDMPELFLPHNRNSNMPVIYSAVLVWLLLALFILGKIPVGIHRLNAFMTPALGIIVIYILSEIGTIRKAGKVINIVFAGLFLAAVGNVVSSFINTYTSDNEVQLRHIYHNMEKGLDLAYRHHLPLMISPDIAYPYEDMTRAKWVIQTNPTYQPSKILPVLTICDQQEANSLLHLKRMQQAVYIGADTARIIQ